MTPFYNTLARKVALQEAAASWIGTPFMGNAAVKGAGVSCQTLAARIYIESGFLPKDFQIVTAPMEWSRAQTESLLVKSLNELPEYFAPLPLAPRASGLAPGDLLGFKIGGCVHHCAIFMDISGTIIHTLRGHGTIYSTIQDATYLSRLENAWRPLAQTPDPRPQTL